MPPLPLTAVFADLPDPRRETANKRHALTDILAIATCAVIGGAGSYGMAFLFSTMPAIRRKGVAQSSVPCETA